MKDQQQIVEKFLSFWHEGEGVTYNASRHVALKSVTVKNDLESTIQAIFEGEGKLPLIIATSAQNLADSYTAVNFHEQDKIWSQNRPVLLLLGTGRGLASDVLKKVDYILSPIEGLTAYNHLSVRSAAAIIFDRWLGINPK